MSDLLKLTNLIITKATLQAGALPGRWACVASDTGPDKVEERTSLALFQDWIERMEAGKSETFLPPPRMPFLGLSHYPGLNGRGEAGPTEKAYIDGNRFKACGTFNDNPLGRELGKAIIEEKALIKKGEFSGLPIRISAGWYDISHKHVDHNYTFVRQSMVDKCPICETFGPDARNDKVYLAGQLDHFACTRVPLNSRTDITAEVSKSMAKTRLDDAKSIVPEDLAEELDQEAIAVGKSESEAEELPEGMVVRSEEEDASPDTEKMGDHGKKKPNPMTADDTVDEEELDEAEMEALRGKGKKKNPMKSETEDKVQAEPEPEEKGDYGMESDRPRPFGGATSMKDAVAHIKANDKLDQVYSRFLVFNTVIRNISSDPMMDAKAKVKAMTSAVNELSSGMSTLKAAIEDSYLIEDLASEPNGKTDDEFSEEQAEHYLYQNLYEAKTMSNPETPEQETFDDKAKAIKANVALSVAERREQLQALLNEQAQAFKSDLEREEAAFNGSEAGQLSKLTEAMAAIAKSQADLNTTVALLAQKVQTGPEAGLPVQKSITSQPHQQAVQPATPEVGGVQVPKGLMDFVNRSVGL